MHDPKHCGPLRSQMLTTPEALAEFSAEYTRRSGHASDLDYLARAQVRGFYCGAGTLRGGYAVATEDLRYLAALPEGVCPLAPERCAESTHIWIDRSVGFRARARIYLRAMLDLMGTGRPYLLGGTTVAKVARVQQQGMPHLIYDGPVSVGEETHRGMVYYGTRSTVVRGFLVGFVRRLVKLGRRRRAKPTGPVQPAR